MRRFGETMKFRRIIGVMLAGCFTLGIVACSETPQEKVVTEAKEREEKAAEDRKKSDKDFRDQLTRILYDRKKGWTEGEITFTEAGNHYLVTSSGQIHCSAKFLLIPGPGSPSRDSDKDARFTLIEVVYGYEKGDGIKVSDLPADFRNPDNFTKDKFTKIVRKYRDSYPKLKEICTDS